MALKNPAVIKFRDALKKAYRRGEIKQNGNPISKTQYVGLVNAIFGPKADISKRKFLMASHMRRWVTEFKVEFPSYVWTGMKTVSKEKPKGFWDNVLDGVIAVASSPVFSAVIGVATAAIPGVGAVLAPIAVIVQRKVTQMVVDARDGKSPKASAILEGAAELAAAGASAASPAAAAMVNRAKEVVATARHVAASPEVKELTAKLSATRRLIVKAQSGDAHAAAAITATVEEAKKGHKPSIAHLALISAVAKGMKDRKVPKATRAEKKHFGRIAILKFGKLPPAAQALARSAASPSSPVAKLPVEETPEELEQAEPEELEEELLAEDAGEEDQDEDQGGETGLTLRGLPAPRRFAEKRTAKKKSAPAKRRAPHSLRRLPSGLALGTYKYPVPQLPDAAAPMAKADQSPPAASAAELTKTPAGPGQASSSAPFPAFSVVEPDEDDDSDDEDDEEDDAA